MIIILITLLGLVTSCEGAFDSAEVNIQDIGNAELAADETQDPSKLPDGENPGNQDGQALEEGHTPSAGGPPKLIAKCDGSVFQDESFLCSDVVATSANSDVFTFALDRTSNCSWLKIDGDTGELSGLPQDDDVGDCIGKIIANDGLSDSNLFEVKLMVQNLAPILPLVATRNILRDSGLAVLISDGDNQATDEGFGSYSLDQVNASSPKCDSNGTIQINSLNGEIIFQPTVAYSGSCFIRYYFDDENGGDSKAFAEVQVNVNVIGNTPPRISGICTLTILEGSSILCTLTGTDPEGDPLSWTKKASSNCDFSGINASTGVITSTPNDDQVGACTLSVSATDGVVDSDLLVFAIEVENVSPTLTIGTLNSVTEDNGSTLIAASGEINSSDEGFGIYELGTPDLAPPCSDNGTLSVDPTNGAINFNPAADYNGTCHGKLMFNDQNVTNNMVSEPFQISVSPVPDSPEIQQNCGVTVAQDVEYLCEPNATDADGTIVFSWWENSITTTCDWLTINPVTGKFTGTPTDDEVGICDYVFYTKDPEMNPSAYETVSITVINVAPTLAINNPAAYLETNNLTTLRTNVQVQASDEGFGVYSDISVADPDLNPTAPYCADKGTLTIDPSTGQIDFTTDADYYGTCYVMVKFDDGNIANGIVTAEIKVDVTNVNDTPYIFGSCPTTAILQDSEFSCDLTIVDADPDDNHVWSFDGANSCAWATINAATGHLGGTPNDNQVGNCTILIKINDGTVNSGLRNFPITVTNRSPTLTIADSIAFLEDSGDTAIKADADIEASEETFGLYSIGVPASFNCNDSGILSINGDTGAMSFNPTLNFQGTCHAKVIFNDGNSVNNTVSATFTVTVTNVNDTPVLLITNPCTLELNQDESYSCPISVLDPDPNDVHTYIKQPGHTCTWMNPSSSGILEGTPNDDDVTAACHVAIKASDSKTASNVVEFDVKVNNLVPVFSNIYTPSAIPKNSPKLIVKTGGQVTTNEEGFGSYSLETPTGAPSCVAEANDVLLDSTDGNLKYAPNTDFSGTCYFKIVFSDGNGGIASKEFTVEVLADVNMPYPSLYGSGIEGDVFHSGNASGAGLGSDLTLDATGNAKYLTAARNIIGFTGSAGQTTINLGGGNLVLNDADANTITEYEVGDEIMWMVMSRGAAGGCTGDYKPGSYGFSKIIAVSNAASPTVVVSPELTGALPTAISLATSSLTTGNTITFCSMQIVRVPNFNTLTIDSASDFRVENYSPAAGKGGIFVFRARNTIDLSQDDSGVDITASYRGYPGSTAGSTTQAGRGFYGGRTDSSSLAHGNGGGGITDPAADVAGSGSNAGSSIDAISGTAAEGGQTPQSEFTCAGSSGYCNPHSQILMGGGGGGSAAEQGGFGGALIMIFSREIANGTLTVKSNGGDRTVAGAGAGGSILITHEKIGNNGQIKPTAKGGSSGSGSAGGGGLIRVNGCSSSYQISSGNVTNIAGTEGYLYPQGACVALPW